MPRIIDQDPNSKTYGLLVEQSAPPTVTVEKYTTNNAPVNSTLSGIAKANGTTVAELLKLNPKITNPNLIYTGQQITLPGQTPGAGAGAGSTVPDYSGVKDIATANNAINQDQQQDVTTTTDTGEPAVRKTTADIMKELSAQVTPETAKPTANLTQSMNEYRTQYGITDLETQVDQLRAQEQELLNNKQMRVNAEQGKNVAMNVIAGRVGEVERQENERIAAVQRNLSNATNQLNTKYNIVNTLMKTAEFDYNAAVDSYDKQMSTNIAMFNAARGIEEDAKNDIEKAQDNARSNAQIMLNAMTDAGTSYADLSPDERSNLTKLGVQSGLGAGFFTSLMKNANGENAKNILTTIKSDDDTKISIIYKDGTTKTIATGLTAKPKAGGGGLTKTELKAQQLEDDRMNVQADVGSITGDDRKVDPTKMIDIRQNIALNTPELLTWFDNAYEPAQMLNSKNYPGAVAENSWLVAAEENQGQ